tara:strand:+ start:205 stop:846 length:642 start_codon:yes stop_codon:yes gene_type:complete
MKYYLELRAVVHEDFSMESKHSKLISSLEHLSANWNLSSSQSPSLSPGDPCAVLTISKCLPKGVRGEIVYQRRLPYDDKASNDDYISINFDPNKVEYKKLIEQIFPGYISAFQPYWANIYDEEFTFLDFTEIRKQQIEARHQIYRISPVTYLHQNYTQRALGMTPEQVIKKLDGNVERVELISGGVYIILSSYPLPTEEMDKLCWKAKGFLMK